MNTNTKISGKQRKSTFVITICCDTTGIEFLDKDDKKHFEETIMEVVTITGVNINNIIEERRSRDSNKITNYFSSQNGR